MTNQASEDKLDEILTGFAYGEYTEHWTDKRKTYTKLEAKQALLDWHNKQTEALLNEMLVDVSSPSARIDQAEMIELINLYINKLKESE